MNMPSISFIVPYHNVETDLLRRSLQSIRALPLTDWEVWVIDDGSETSEGKNFIASLDSARFHYIRQEHKGPGGARNTGMQKATKEYIQFLDADDYLFPETYTACLRLIRDKKPDVLLFHAFVTRCVGVEQEHAVPFQHFVTSGTDYMRTHNLRSSVWGGIIRREILKGLSFTEHIYHEDEEFTPLFILRARRLIETTAVAYAYYRRSDSIMCKQDLFHIRKRFEDAIGVFIRLTAFLDTLEEDCRSALERRINQLAGDMVYRLLKEAPDEHFMKVYLDKLKQTGRFPLKGCYTVKQMFYRTIVNLRAGRKILRHILHKRT